MDNEMDEAQVIADAIEKHCLEIDPTCPNVQALVRYALHVGYNAGVMDKAQTAGTENSEMRDLIRYLVHTAYKSGLKDGLKSFEKGAT